MYNRFRVSSPIHTLHTAITHVLILLELWGVSRANCDWNSPEPLQFQYFNHVSDCSVQWANGSRSPETTIYSMYMYVVHIVTRGCHGHTESVGVSVSVLCNLKMTVQLLYVASVGLKSPRYICILCTCRYFPLP